MIVAVVTWAGIVTEPIAVFVFEPCESTVVAVTPAQFFYQSPTIY